MANRAAAAVAAATKANECGGQTSATSRTPNQSSVDTTLLAMRRLAEMELAYIKGSVDNYVLQAWDSAYNNFTALNNDWHHHATPKCLLVNGIAVQNATKPTSNADQIDFLRDAVQRMKRVRDVIQHVLAAAAHRQQLPACPDFLARLHSAATKLVCELVTALRAAGVEPATDSCSELGEQDRLVEYLVVREFIQLLNHVIGGARQLLALSPLATAAGAEAVRTAVPLTVESSRTPEPPASAM